VKKPLFAKKIKYDFYLAKRTTVSPVKTDNAQALSVSKEPSRKEIKIARLKLQTEKDVFAFLEKKDDSLSLLLSAAHPKISGNEIDYLDQLRQTCGKRQITVVGGGASLSRIRNKMHGAVFYLQLQNHDVVWRVIENHGTEANVYLRC
jgi:hypothetical protein